MTQFLTNVPVTEDASSPITLVLNWTAGLEKSWLTKPDRPQFRGFWMAQSDDRCPMPCRLSRLDVLVIGYPAPAFSFKSN